MQRLYEICIEARLSFPRQSSFIYCADCPPSHNGHHVASDLAWSLYREYGDALHGCSEMWSNIVEPIWSPLLGVGEYTAEVPEHPEGLNAFA